MESSVEIVKTRRRYSLDTKRNILRALTECTQKDVSSRSGIPLRTIQNFVREKDKIIASLRAKRCHNIGYSGRKDFLTPRVSIDNFDAHTTAKNIAFVEEELSSVLCTLPPNTTSVLQPLDVGVMGPFKAKLRNLLLSETCCGKANGLH
ncbi:hypothetical protein AeMF1_021233 [Aphanomyces euteiches]|nr:hypothetical protein AeMF1_021233 [Aphanomyces euteiches]